MIMEKIKCNQLCCMYSLNQLQLYDEKVGGDKKVIENTLATFSLADYKIVIGEGETGAENCFRNAREFFTIQGRTTNDSSMTPMRRKHKLRSIRKVISCNGLH